MATRGRRDCSYRRAWVSCQPMKRLRRRPPAQAQRAILGPKLNVCLETLSDLEAPSLPNVYLQRQGKYTETFEPGGGSESDTANEMEVDSEATVSDLDTWASGSDTVDQTVPWQPTQRLTARQLARQERLLQGISQTQWSDMHLPRGLDLSNKAKEQQIATEEQYLKRMKAAETRRARTQKARRDTMEITKARIRAASSAKFRDLAENGQTEKQKTVNRERRCPSDNLRFRHLPGRTVMEVPERLLPEIMEPHKCSGYPLSRRRRKLVLEDGFKFKQLTLGMSLHVAPTDGRLKVLSKGYSLGYVLSTKSPVNESLMGRVTSIYYHKHQPRAILLTLESSVN